MSTDDDRPQILDDDGLTQNKRTKQVLKQRKELVDIRAQLKHELHRDAIGRFEAETLFRDSLESYLLNLEPLFLTHGDGRYWKQSPLGSFEATPDVSGAPDRTVDVTGLVDILDMPSPIEVEWTGTDPSVHGSARRTQTAEVQIPFGILDTALRQTNYALSEFGFVLELDDGDDEFEI